MEEVDASPLPLPASHLKLLSQTKQNPRYHAEGSVLRHTEMVLAAYQDHHEQFALSDADHEVLYWAAVLHDLGKITHTRWDKGRWRAKGHERAGVPLARALLLSKPEISPEQRQRILDIVKYHAVPLQWGLHPRPLTQYKQLATRTDLRLLGIFAYFDIVGRLCEDKPNIVGIIERFNRELVPRTHYELGSYAELQQAFHQASYQHKNALWHSLQQQETDLLEKLAQAPTRPGKRPLFTCVMPIGVDSPALRDYLRQSYPGFLTFEAGEIGISYRDKFNRETQLRQLKHFVSVYGRDQKNLILAGLPVDPAVRTHVADYCRQQGAHLEYLFCEQTQESLSQQSNDAQQQQRFERSFQALDFPHPWEPHRLHRAQFG